MHGHANLMTLQFLEIQSHPSLWRDLYQQGHLELRIAQSAQHFLRGQIVKLHMHPGAGLPEVSQRARQKFNRQ